MKNTQYKDGSPSREWEDEQEKDAFPCVSCGRPSQTSTPDHADMCCRCFGEFNSTNYDNLKKKFIELLQRDYPDADIESALDECRPLPDRPAPQEPFPRPHENGQQQQALDILERLERKALSYSIDYETPDKYVATKRDIIFLRNRIKGE